MQIVTTTAELAKICKAFAASPYVTVDTEFLREVTFWPELCLIQMAAPDDAVIIDDGQVVFTGRMADVAADEALQARYLGVGARH